MDGWHPHVAAAAVIPRIERTTIYLDVDQRRRLRSLAASSDRPRDQLIREAIDRYLGRRDVFRLPSWVGAWGAGPLSTVILSGIRSGRDHARHVRHRRALR